ncbi:MAG: ATP/GTP-binding protein [Promethearchaeati archaeon SRVP18_Atabeyarchaeia-1]
MKTKSSPVNVVFLGTAGSGKTTMVHRLGRWLKESRGYQVIHVNLDPACLDTPYRPDFDIRSIFTTEDVMRREKLGPNAAIVRCSDLMAERADEMARFIGDLEGDFRLIDTPGQTEIFVFRESGPKIMKALTNYGYTLSVMLFDKALASTPIDIATAQLMTLVVQLRIAVPMITAISKADLLPDSSIDSLLSNQALLTRAIEEEVREGGVYKDLSLELPSLIKTFKPPARIIKTSALTETGFTELLDIINETYCACGDLT